MFSGAAPITKLRSIEGKWNANSEARTRSMYERTAGAVVQSCLSHMRVHVVSRQRVQGWSYYCDNVAYSMLPSSEVVGSAPTGTELCFSSTFTFHHLIISIL